MPTRDSAPIGAPCWVDLMTPDAKRSRAFYTELFGWSAEEPDEQFGGYFNYTKDGARIAGCMQDESATGPRVWSIYLATDDAEKTIEAAVANGGQVHVAPMAVGDLGSMAIIVDPAGAVIGLWQPGAHPGFQEYAEPNAPAWFELHTRAYDEAVRFYREVFRVEPRTEADSPDFRYTVLTAGGEDVAGIMDASGYLPEGAPPQWKVYFQVADVDAAIDQAVALGGAVVDPAQDTPYGRLAELTDAVGVSFKLSGPNVSTSAG